MVNNSTIITIEPLRPHFFTEEWETVITILFVCVSVSGIVANSCVLYIILSVKELQTPLNLLLMNLSIADLIGSLGIYPMVFLDVSRTTIRGDTADLLCVLSIGLVVFFACSGESILTLCAISISRFIIIKFPLKVHWKLTKRGSIYVIVISWIVSIALLLPNGMSFRYEVDTGYCYRYERPGINMQAYSIITTVFGTVLPITTMALTYFAIWRQLWKKPDFTNATPGTLQSRKQIVKTLGVLMAAYIACWSPFFTYWTMASLLKYYSDTPSGRIKIFRFYTIAVLFGLCNSTLDPIIYTLRGEKFKKAIKNLLTRILRSGNEVLAISTTRRF